MLELVAKKSFFRPGPTSRPRLFAVGLLLVVLSSLGLTVSAPLASASVTEMELSVHRLVNEHRAAQGLKPLAFSPEISDIARVHSEDMASGRVGFGHDGFGRRSAQSGGAAENVAFSRTDRGAVSSWLSSPGHRRNIEGDYNLTGIGIARHPYRGYYFTQLFTWGSAGPPPTSPPPSASPLPESAGEAVTAALELYVHVLVNEHRAAQGLKPLTFSPEISDIARVHSEDMASGRVPGGHAGADGRSEKISNSIPYREFGENVAEINQGGEGGEGAAAVSGWLQSPGHRSNIEGSFDLTGIGIALAASGTYFFTQLFVTPAGKQPGSYGNDPQPLSAHAALTVPKIMATYGDEPPPPAATTRPAPARQARATGPAYSEKAPSRRPGRRRTAGGWAQKLEPRKRRPEKDPRRRPGRRRTAGGWVQKLE